MIGIIGALDMEVHALCEKLEDPETKTSGSLTFVSGKLGKQDVVLARAGVGKVNAAVCATAMITLYHPEEIINTGIAGAVSPDLTVGDAVVSTSFVQYDMDTTSIGDPLGYLSGLDIIEIPADLTVQSHLLFAAKSTGLHTVCGKVATGDTFVASKERKDRLRETFGADICEMEGGAIAQACYIAGVPFCALRVISDNANGDAQVDYPTFSADAAQKGVEVILAYLN